MDELTLLSGVPVLLTPTKATATIQNTMPSTDDKLYFSAHGDVDKKWMTLCSEEKFVIKEATNFLQIGRSSWIFPVYESD